MFNFTLVFCFLLLCSQSEFFHYQCKISLQERDAFEECDHILSILQSWVKILVVCLFSFRKQSGACSVCEREGSGEIDIRSVISFANDVVMLRCSLISNNMQKDLVFCQQSELWICSGMPCIFSCQGPDRTNSPLLCTIIFLCS